jgi:catechol 2,3-dioxygenase-like lactoylglutathione lyase family enzyme
MFSGGNVTVYVSNMDRAVRFYSEALGLKLAYRFGDHWASIEAGTGLTIGLHPAFSEMPAGRKGSMAIGLQLNGSIGEAVSALKAKGVRFQGDVINEGKAGSFIGFEDPATSSTSQSLIGATSKKARASISQRKPNSLLKALQDEIFLL